MNKLYKCALGLLTAFTLSFACFSNAGLELINTESFNGIYNDQHYSCNGCDLLCLNTISCNWEQYGSRYDGVVLYNFDKGNLVQGIWPRDSVALPGNMGVCTTGGIIYYSTNTRCSFNFNSYNFTEYTSSECQTEYNLIPIDEVNANYCNLNFGMIDPRECPTTEGSGAISWTPRFINDEQYPGTNLLNINIPDDIAHTVIYNEEETIVNVEGYNADENYINGILQNEKLTPTNKDIEEMITGFMLNYFPYLALAIVFLYLARKIFKLFK